LREAANLGFKTAVIPKQIRRRTEQMPQGMEILEARTLREALEKALLHQEDN
jgi:DNA repair protein RadA/Sms